MNNRIARHSFILFLLFGIMFISPGCITTWVIKKNEVLYKKSKLKITHNLTYKKVYPVVEDLNDNIFPEPNSNIFGLKAGVWLYELMGTPKRDKGLRYSLKYRYGEAPVLLSDVEFKSVEENFQNILQNNGYFNATISHKIDTLWWDHKRAKIIYYIQLNTPYDIVRYSYNIKDTALLNIIRSQESQTLLNVPLTYNFNTILNEQTRISNLLRKNGYYYFSPDFVMYKADSTLGNHQMSLTLSIEKDVDPTYLQQWNINNVTVHRIGFDSLSQATDTTVQGLRYVNIKPFYRPDRLSQYILFKKGDLFNSQDYQTTLRNLASLDAFQFTNIDFTPKTLNDSNYIDANIDLVPNKKYTLYARAKGEKKSTDFLGPSLEAGLVDRNIFHGMEKLTFNVKGDVETYIGKNPINGALGNLNYSLTSSATVEIPRFLFLPPRMFSKQYIPKTSLSIEYKFINQALYYKMSVFRTNFGYKWYETANKQHEFNISDISYQFVSRKTPRFDSLSTAIPYLAKGFEDQMIVSSNYTFKYRSPNPNKKITMAFIGNIDGSGNFLRFVQFLETQLGGNPNYGTLFKNTYSRYVRLSTDLRGYWKYIHKNTMAARLFAGVGIPLGHSTALPLIKQFYTGGTNSVRAFRAGAIGPGTYNEGNVAVGSGDIKLEANFENRYQFTKQYEFAIFADAGNNWLVNSDPQWSGGVFDINKFYKQLAVGAGIGLRYINEYFIIRLDLGFPLRFPDKSTSKLYKPILQLALGYSI